MEDDLLRPIADRLRFGKVALTGMDGRPGASCGHVMQGEQIRLAEILAAMSMATDTAIGGEDEGALRRCVLAVGLGRAVGAPEADVVCAYFAALLQHLGCTSIAADGARMAGDDHELNQVLAAADPGRPANFLGAIFKGVGRAAGGLARPLTIARFLASAHLVPGIARTACEIGVKLAHRLGMNAGVQRALNELGERHDGKGLPQHLAGEAISLAARLVMLADVAVFFHRMGGVEAARAEVRQRAGRHFDPAIAKVFLAEAPALLAPLDQTSVWELALEAEPQPWRMVPGSDIASLAGVLGDYTDLKSPFTVGHSPAVAALAQSAGRELGLSDAELATLKTAALLHDLGRVAVSNSIWDKPGPLTAAEWERVRLHPYHTERLLACSPTLRPIAQLAGADHERLDGSGYFRSGTTATTSARVLAAADVYQALLEERPHRPAFKDAEAARMLADEAKGGRLDREAVGAVLAAAGHRSRQVRGAWPAGLSDREVEVLRLLARGLQNKQIGKVLFISPRTVQHHTIHIYQKAGVETRAGAALFAAEHDLLRR